MSILKLAKLTDDIYMEDVFFVGEGDKRLNAEKNIMAGEVMQNYRLGDILNRRQDERDFNKQVGNLAGGVLGTGVGASAGALINKIRKKPKAVGAMLGGVSGMYGGGGVGGLLGSRKDVEEISVDELNKLVEISEIKHENMQRLQDYNDQWMANRKE